MRRRMKGLLRKSLEIEAMYEFCPMGMSLRATWARDGGVLGFSWNTKIHEYHKSNSLNQIWTLCINQHVYFETKTDKLLQSWIMKGKKNIVPHSLYVSSKLLVNTTSVDSWMDLLNDLNRNLFYSCFLQHQTMSFTASVMTQMTFQKQIPAEIINKQNNSKIKE